MTTKMVNMEFDGKAVSVPEGMTLVDAGAAVGSTSRTFATSRNCAAWAPAACAWWRWRA